MYKSNIRKYVFGKVILLFTDKKLANKTFKSHLNTFIIIYVNVLQNHIGNKHFCTFLRMIQNNTF